MTDKEQLVKLQSIFKDRLFFYETQFQELKSYLRSQECAPLEAKDRINSIALELGIDMSKAASSRMEIIRNDYYLKAVDSFISSLRDLRNILSLISFSEK